MNPSKYLIPILLILLILAVLTSTIFYTFQVGSVKPASATATNPNSSSSIAGPQPKDRYPDQVHITVGITLFGLIIVAILLFDIAWGRQMTRFPGSEPPRPVPPIKKPAPVKARGRFIH